MTLVGAVLLLLLLFITLWEIGVPAKPQAQSVITAFIPLPMAEPPTGVVAVQASCNSTKTTVRWRIPATGGPYTSYTAKTGELTNSVRSVGEILTSTVYGDPTYTVNGKPAPTTAIMVGLEKGTTYTFSVTAQNAGGESTRSLPSNLLTVC